MPRLLLIVFFSAIAHFASGQDISAELENLPNSSQKKYDQALHFIRSGNWVDAEQTLNKLISKHPDITTFQLKLAGVHYENKAFQQAASILNESIKKSPQIPVKFYYFLAISEWEIEEYEAAATHFEYFISNAEKKSKLLSKAMRYHKNALFASKAVLNPPEIEISPLSSNINSSLPEYLPSITADGETLVFTRRINHQEDIFICTWDGKKWVDCLPLDELNTPYNDAAQAISADGRTIAFVTSDRDISLGSLDIFVSDFKFGKWQKPRNIGRPVNSGYWESQPSLSAHGDQLFYSSNRPDGAGGRDIWSSKRIAINKWSEPENIGDKINTPYNEESPFIHPDGETLYFMSNGHPGMGGSDLFMSRKNKQGEWGEPVNLGIPINSKGDQGALFVDLQGKYAYYASDQNKNNAIDIFRFPLPLAYRPSPVTYVKLTVKDKQTRRPLNANGALTSLDDSHSTVLNLENGEGLFCLPSGKAYALHVELEGYIFHSEHFDVKHSDEMIPQEIEVLLSSASRADKQTEEKENPVVLRNVFFDTGSATLLETSTLELSKLIQLLNNHPDLKIQLNGHTDNVGDETDNLNLSEERAKSVYSYLIDHGISADRLMYKGFGEQKPIADNEKKEGRQKNRRTEFVILSD